MQSYRCKCGKGWYSGSYPPSKCQGCDKCNTTYAQRPEDHKVPEPHNLETRYNQNTGKPYEMCMDCMYVDEEQYRLSKIKDGK